MGLPRMGQIQWKISVKLKTQSQKISENNAQAENAGLTGL